MSTPLHIMELLLTAAGAGTPGVDLFVGRMPDTPEICTSVMNYQGMPPEATHDQPTAYERPSYQVLVRGLRQDGVYECEARARETWAYLGEIVNATVGGTRVLRVRRYQSPFQLPADKNDHVLFAFNGELLLGA